MTAIRIRTKTTTARTRTIKSPIWSSRKRKRQLPKLDVLVSSKTRSVLDRDPELARQIEKLKSLEGVTEIEVSNLDGELTFVLHGYVRLPNV